MRRPLYDQDADCDIIGHDMIGSAEFGFCSRCHNEGGDVVSLYLYTTLGEAQEALAAAFADVRGDMGDQAAEEGWYDIVQSVAGFCSPAVASELRRINL